MSLDGLDAREVNEAYASALGEGGGWCVSLSASRLVVANVVQCRFLLKYAGRAEVDLLGKGIGGLSEVKEAVDRYGEQSPLYGFVQYRRRKVVLKYVPEGTSRLFLGMLKASGCDAQILTIAQHGCQFISKPSPRSSHLRIQYSRSPPQPS